MCVCMRVSGPLELELQLVVSHHAGGCWESNLYPQEEKPVFFTCQAVSPVMKVKFLKSHFLFYKTFNCLENEFIEFGEHLQMVPIEWLIKICVFG